MDDDKEWKPLTQDEIKAIWAEFNTAKPTVEVSALDAALVYTETGDDDLLWELNKNDG